VRILVAALMSFRFQQCLPRARLLRRRCFEVPVGDGFVARARKVARRRAVQSFGVGMSPKVQDLRFGFYGLGLFRCSSAGGRAKGLIGRVGEWVGRVVALVGGGVDG